MARRKKWARIVILKPAELQSPWYACDSSQSVSVFSISVCVLLYFLSPDVDRHAGHISFTVSVCLSVCVRKIFCKGYLWHGLTLGDEIWQDGRPGWVAGETQGLTPKGQKVKIFGNAHLVDCLHDVEAPAAGLRQVWHHQI